MVSGLWELPINRLFGSDNGVVKALTEGWQVNTIASFQSGTPFTIFQDNGSSGQGSFLERADLVGPTHTFDPRATRTFTAGDVQGSCLPVNPGETVNGNFYFDPTATIG